MLADWPEPRISIRLLHLDLDLPTGRQEVCSEVLGRVLGIEPDGVDVSVRRGVVRLRGAVDRRSTALIAVSPTHVAAGVVDVVDELTFEYDDSADVRRHYTFDAQTPPVTPEVTPIIRPAS